jgi:hypothetical protein
MNANIAIENHPPIRKFLKDNWYWYSMFLLSLCCCRRRRRFCLRIDERDISNLSIFHIIIFLFHKDYKNVQVINRTIILNAGSQRSTVCIATGCELGDRRVRVLVLIIQTVYGLLSNGFLGTVFWWGKQPGPEADHSAIVPRSRKRGFVRPLQL